MKALEFELVETATPNTTLKLGISDERMQELSHLTIHTVMSNFGKGGAHAMQQFAKIANTVQEFGFLCKSSGLIEAQLAMLPPAGLSNIPPEYVMKHDLNDLLKHFKK